MRLAIAGCGRAGRILALAVAGRKGPVTLASVASRSRRRAAALARRLPGVTAVVRVEELPSLADLILLCVPDDAIEEVAGRMAGRSPSLRGRVILHLSGALGIGPLEPARLAGAAVGSLHPLAPFPPAPPPDPSLAGTWFVAGGQLRARRAARLLIGHLGGHELAVPERSREVYHLAATLVANHTTILAALAMDLLASRGGVRGPRARKAFASLLRAAAGNLEAVGPHRALTGPASRGDLITLERHMAFLRSEGEDLEALYALLSQRGVEIARRRGSLDERRARKARSLLRARRKAR